jgi:hypothetical protein
MKTVIEMAKQAGAIPIHKSPKEFALVGNEALERFAELVRADAIASEREACAKVCDVLAVHPEYAALGGGLAAMAIRNRSNK